MITCTVTNRFSNDLAPIQLLCVGKPKGKTYFRWWKHTPSLAPSAELVTYTVRNKRGNWWEFYTEKLITEWESSKSFKSSIKMVMSYLDEGLDVAVACYCLPLGRERCHLSMLASIFQDLGYECIEAEEVN